MKPNDVTEINFGKMLEKSCDNCTGLWKIKEKNYCLIQSEYIEDLKTCPKWHINNTKTTKDIKNIQ
jgi:hypothetical protein